MNDPEDIPRKCKECVFFEFESREESFCKDQSQVRGTKRVLHGPFEIPTWCKFYGKGEDMNE